MPLPSKSLRKFVHDALDVGCHLLVLLRCGAVDDGRLGLHVEGKRGCVLDAHESELVDISFVAGLATDRTEVVRQSGVEVTVGHRRPPRRHRGAGTSEGRRRCRALRSTCRRLPEGRPRSTDFRDEPKKSPRREPRARKAEPRRLSPTGLKCILTQASISSET